MSHVTYSGISHPDTDDDVEVEIRVKGEPQEVVEKVAMDAKDRVVRAIQAMDECKHVNEVDIEHPIGSIAWDRIDEWHSGGGES